MHAVARRILRNEENARDACQEAYLVVARSIHGFSSRARLATWLHRIVVNACLMRLRSDRRRPEVPFAALGRVHAEIGVDPDIGLDAVRKLCRVRRVLASLPTTYREVLILRHVEGRDSRQTARLLRTTPNAVNIRLYRARKALATRLLDVGPAPQP
jgi:RNA polymerase sigma-70 factor (ECF subfamily)